MSKPQKVEFKFACQTLEPVVNRAGDTVSEFRIDLNAPGALHAILMAPEDPVYISTSDGSIRTNSQAVARVVDQLCGIDLTPQNIDKIGPGVLEATEAMRGFFMQRWANSVKDGIV